MKLMQISSQANELSTIVLPNDQQGAELPQKMNEKATELSVDEDENEIKSR